MGWHGRGGTLGQKFILFGQRMNANDSTPGSTLLALPVEPNRYWNFLLAKTGDDVLISELNYSTRGRRAPRAKARAQVAQHRVRTHRLIIAAASCRRETPGSRGSAWEPGDACEKRRSAGRLGGQTRTGRSPCWHLRAWNHPETNKRCLCELYLYDTHAAPRKRRRYGERMLLPRV